MATWMVRGALVATLLAMTGCATVQNNPKGMCALVGALGAGAIGGGVADDDDKVEGAAIGAAVGAIAGAVFCNEVAPPPLPEAPTPPPPPPPPAGPLDSDGDGVYDDKDECPGTAPGTVVDERGCPEIPDLRGVHFEFNKSNLTPAAQTILDSALGAIQSNPDVKVEIVGHTDSVGSDAYNQKLSERRAESVRAYLESRGVTATRLSAEGRGESEPVATNENEDGRALNRRVDLDAVQLRAY